MTLVRLNYITIASSVLTLSARGSEDDVCGSMLNEMICKKSNALLAVTSGIQPSYTE